MLDKEQQQQQQKCPFIWTFPHSTCERAYEDAMIVQPYSFAITLLAAALLTTAAFRAPNVQSRLAIASYALFETAHSLSHAVRIDPENHEGLMHFCTYLMAVATDVALKTMLPDRGSNGRRWVIGMAIVLDLLVFFNVRGIFSIATGLMVLAAVVANYLPAMPQGKRTMVYGLALSAAGVVLLLAAEAQNCAYARDTWGIDLHPWIVEVPGLILFQMLARLVVA